MTTSAVYIQPGACADVTRGTNIVLENVSGTYMATGNVDHVGILGGDSGTQQGPTVQMADCGLGAVHHVNHVRFDGVPFHDAIQVSSGQHLECMQSFARGPQITSSSATRSSRTAPSGTSRACSATRC